MSNLITEILDKNFLNERDNFGSAPQIDGTKIIGVGHSHGGGAILKVGDSDERISCVIAFDPWSDILNPWLDNMNNLTKKPLQII